MDGQRVPIEKLDKLTWHVKGSGTVTVRYDTFWDDPGPFNSQLNGEHAFINPAMILLYVPERRAEKSVITLSDVPGQWRVASETLSGGVLQSQTFLLEAPATTHWRMPD